MRRRLLAFLVLGVFLLSLGLVGCGQQTAAPQKKVLRVGCEATYMPFEFQDEKTHEQTGYDMDVVRAIAKEMGMEVQFVTMNFDGLIPALEAGQVDMLASAITITPERSKRVLFSDAYYISGQSILVKADNTTIKSFKDLEGKRIAAQIGTTGAEEAKKIKNAKVREFNTTADMNLELKAGGVDATINDLPVNEYYLAKGGSKDAKLLDEIQGKEKFGLAVQPSNKELIEKVNQALTTIKKNGEFEKIYVKWFGKKPLEAI